MKEYKREKSDMKLTCPRCGDWENTEMVDFGGELKNYYCGNKKCGVPITYSMPRPSERPKRIKIIRIPLDNDETELPPRTHVIDVIFENDRYCIMCWQELKKEELIIST